MPASHSKSDQVCHAGVSADPVLAEHAAEIRRLGKRVIADVIEIGARLTDCREICNRDGRGNWLSWLGREFGWTDETAYRFIRVAELSKQIPQIVDFDLPLSGLYLLAAPSTPETARSEIIERSMAGESVSFADVEQTIKQAKEGRAQPARKPKTPNVEPSDAEEAAALIAAEDKRAAEAQPTDPLKATRKAGEIMGCLIGAGEAVQRVFIRRLPEMLADRMPPPPSAAKEPPRRRLSDEQVQKEWVSRSPEGFEVGDELRDLVAKQAPDWTGTIVTTQAETEAAAELLRDDGAVGHWLIVAPHERVIVDHRVFRWLLLTQPAPPVIAHIEWVFALCGAAEKARCPIWVSEHLTGKSRPQRAGMRWPQELPIPRDDIGPNSASEAERRLRIRNEELEHEVSRLKRENATLRAELDQLRASTAQPPAADGLDIPDFLDRTKRLGRGNH